MPAAAIRGPPRRASLWSPAALRPHSFLTTAVPTPPSPKKCWSVQCCTRPSMMTALPQPPLTASHAVSSLGIMPPVMTPSALSRATCSRLGLGLGLGFGLGLGLGVMDRVRVGG